MQNKIVMKYPAAWHGEMWREGAACGNGIVGALVYGGITREIILLNHAYLWRGGNTCELPYVSAVLPEIRSRLDNNDPNSADVILPNALRQSGYHGDNTQPLPLCDLVLNFPTKGTFSHYRRIIDMEKATVTVSYTENGVSYQRETFVSREDGLCYTRITCDRENAIELEAALTTHDRETLGSVQLYSVEAGADSEYLYYAGENKGEFSEGDYGGVCRVITDGEKSVSGDKIKVTNASEVILAVSLFIATQRHIGFENAKSQLNSDLDYCSALKKHFAKHFPLYSAVDLSISAPNGATSNEELLLEAFEDEASAELIEKLYAYGRYLFICSTGSKSDLPDNTDTTLPCHLVGLWNGTYNCFWAIYMYNINFEMIYWNAASGNLLPMLKVALDYTEAFLPDFRENAKKLYGQNGIYINSVNTPESGLSKCGAAHILNWTGGAAWFSQHFWDYYRFSGDMDYLREHSLPFMAETAEFYEGFAVEDENGHLMLYPSTSPENSAGNIRNAQTSINATLELSLLRELLTNLLSGVELTGLYSERADKWREMLAKIPPYMINEDGAVKEWTHTFYEDNYHHRHQSHLYPIFPGCSVKKGDRFYDEFVTAEKKRLEVGISDMSSWSMMFMVGVFARMGMGDNALFALSNMARTCCMNNFFTTHNDWRRMGPVWCDDFRIAPFQIDGNIGLTGVVNEMLLQSQNDDIFILPALPAKWKQGSIKGLLARGNIICDITWKDGAVSIKLHSQAKPCEKYIHLGENLTFADGTSEKTVLITNDIIEL